MQLPRFLGAPFWGQVNMLDVLIRRFRWIMLLFGISILLLLWGCAPDGGISKSDSFSTKSSADEPSLTPDHHRVVSFLRLASNPGEYDGKTFTIFGFLDTDGEDGKEFSLYVSSDAFDYSLRNEMIALEVPPSLKAAAMQAKGKFVAIDGTFTSSKGNNELVEIGVMSKLDMITVVEKARRQFQ
jgi:hypothetical protein